MGNRSGKLFEWNDSSIQLSIETFWNQISMLSTPTGWCHSESIFML